MINIDTRILEAGMTEPELWLMVHITKRLNKHMFCFPSNRTLLKDTGWGIDKLRLVKGSLVQKGFLTIDARFREDRRTSNVYTVKTDLIGVYVGADRMSKARGEEPIYPNGKTEGEGEVENPIGEALPREEVYSESNDSGTQNTLFGDEPKKATEKRKKKPVDECHAGFRELWKKYYPIMAFDGSSGRMINDLIRKTKAHMTGAGKTFTKESCQAYFQYVLEYVKREKHWVHEKPLTTFNHQYLSVVTEIVNGKTVKTNEKVSRFSAYSR